MPKMKSSRQAKKKFRVMASGKIKHARANTSHNTGKKSSKRMRQLQGTKVMSTAHDRHLQRMLPTSGSSKQ